MIRGSGTPKYYTFPTLSNPVNSTITGMELLEFAPPKSITDNCHSIRVPGSKKLLSTPAAVSSKGIESTAHTGLGTILKVMKMEPTAAFIMKTLREAFYINDSINHLLDHLKYYDNQENAEKKKETNWSLEGISGSVVSKTMKYDPSVYVTTPQSQNKSGDPIGIKQLLRHYEQMVDNDPDKIRYCTFACIRSQPDFEEDSKGTLEFATQVNSCPDDTRPAAPGGAARRGLEGGTKTRRNRSQGKVRTQRRRRRIVKPKSHPVTVTTQRRNMRDKKKGRRTRKMT
jgi:hypothetical protein